MGVRVGDESLVIARHLLVPIQPPLRVWSVLNEGVTELQALAASS